MNSIVPIMTLYGLITLGSAGILFFSFKGKVDTSGNYFLIAELGMLPVILQVITTNLSPNLATPLVLFLGNFFYGLSEAAIFFAIYVLTRKNSPIFFISTMIYIAAYCLVLEILRFHYDPKLPLLIAPIFFSIFEFGTFYICRTIIDRDLRSNLFLKWICYLEFILGCISIIRILSNLTTEPVTPRQPALSGIFIFVVIIFISVFRYIAYQSFRMSWANSSTNSENFLNKNLVKALEEKNQLLEKLSISNRMIGMGALASSLAHQLSQPITGLNLHIELLKRHLHKIGSTLETQKLVETINFQLKNITELVKNLRFLFGNQPNNFKKIELTNVSESILKIIEPTIESNKIKFIKNYKSSPVIFCDAIQIQQVLINIFNNAIDAVNDSKKNEKIIQLEINQVGQMAEIAIRDNGLGIDPTVLPTLFELYKTTKKEGMGLGLWLSKIIIEKHHGEIKVENADAGTIFLIQIPVADH
jgi:signal transduction histidine kinase